VGILPYVTNMADKRWLGNLYDVSILALQHAEQQVGSQGGKHVHFGPYVLCIATLNTALLLLNYLEVPVMSETSVLVKVSQRALLSVGLSRAQYRDDGSQQASLLSNRGLMRPRDGSLPVRPLFRVCSTATATATATAPQLLFRPFVHSPTASEFILIPLNRFQGVLDAVFSDAS
jgi:hypothetical protein